MAIKTQKIVAVVRTQRHARTAAAKDRTTNTNASAIKIKIIDSIAITFSKYSLIKSVAAD